MGNKCWRDLNNKQHYFIFIISDGAFKKVTQFDFHEHPLRLLGLGPPLPFHGESVRLSKNLPKVHSLAGLFLHISKGGLFGYHVAGTSELLLILPTRCNKLHFKYQKHTLPISNSIYQVSLSWWTLNGSSHFILSNRDFRCKSQVFLESPFYRRRQRVFQTKWLNDLPRVTQLVIGKLGFEPQAVCSRFLTLWCAEDC